MDDEEQAQEQLEDEQELEEQNEAQGAANPLLFTRHLDVVGRVPMLFYLPDVKESAELKKKIEAYGGRVVDQHQCDCIQIMPSMKEATADFNLFYQGPIYD